MLNRSKTYLAPLVLKDIEEIPLENIENTYIFSDFECLEPILYVIMKPNTITVEELNKLRINAQIMDCFVIGETYLITITISPDHHFEYLCFKRGHYSWFTEEAKVKILDYLHNHVSPKSYKLLDQVRSVFMRDPMLKRYYEKTLNMTLGEEQELGNKMDEKEETFQSYKYENFRRLEEKHKVANG